MKHNYKKTYIFLTLMSFGLLLISQTSIAEICELNKGTITYGEELIDDDAGDLRITIRYITENVEDSGSKDCLPYMFVPQVGNIDNYMLFEEVPGQKEVVITGSDRPENLQKIEIVSIEFLTIGGEQITAEEVKEDDSVTGIIISSHLNKKNIEKYMLIIDEINAEKCSNKKNNCKIEKATLKGDLSELYESHSSCERNVKIDYREKTPVIDFQYEIGKYHGIVNKRVVKEVLTLLGTIPISTPEDVEAILGAKTESSGEVAGHIELSYSKRETDTRSYRSYGLKVISKGRGSSFEGVVFLQPFARFFDSHQKYFGTDFQLGYRNGDEEWKNLTIKAPDRGNLVARFGSQYEYTPQVGSLINNPYSSGGLGFFARGRGWADYYKDDGGDHDVRMRGFLDSEIFIPLNDEWRFYLRYEYGYIPPDLSNKIDAFSIGVGTAF